LSNFFLILASMRAISFATARAAFNVASMCGLKRTAGPRALLRSASVLCNIGIEGVSRRPVPREEPHVDKTARGPCASDIPARADAVKRGPEAHPSALAMRG
jgi:hypothetical protein